MVYIPKDAKFSPGTFLGDAKTLETRGVPYEVTAGGNPRYTFEKGDVVYIDNNGYAVPYRRIVHPEQDAMPYGVVTMVNRLNRTGPQCSVNSNSVTVATEGIVAVPCILGGDGTAVPELGNAVNQFGCLAGPGSTQKHERVIGICDGIGTNPKNAEQKVVAVRLSGGAAAVTGAIASKYQLAQNAQGLEHAKYTNDDDDDTIPAFAPVTVVPSVIPDDGVPLVKQWTSEAQQLYGYAAQQIAPGETGYVVTQGPFELPFVNPETVKDKNAVSRGYQVAWIQKETPDGVPWWEKILIVVRDVVLGAGMIIGVGLGVKKMTTPNSAGTNTGTTSSSSSVLGKTTKNGVGDEPVIDGWFSVDVDPQSVHAPMSLDYVVAADESVQLIPGHVYGGSDSGVTEYQTNWDGYPFAGVCTADLPTEEGKTPLLREGLIDVVAAGNWTAGAYIDYTRHSIPEAYEPYIPHIGVAVANTADGELGAVHLQPWDPNEYIILDRIGLPPAEYIPLNTAVYMDGGTIRGCTPNFSLYNGNYPFLMGVLRRGIKDYTPSALYNKDRAIIQVGGYVSAPVPQYATLDNIFGHPVRALGEDWMDVVPVSWIGENTEFVQLGTVVSTFSDAESTENIVIVKLDIKHHSKIHLVTGREDVRLDVKKVIPLVIWSSDSKMHPANDDDRFFTIEGLDSEVYTDPIWHDEFNIIATPITQSAAELTFDGTKRGIIASIDLVNLTSNKIRMTIAGDIPDQWDDDDYRVLGYQFEMLFSAVTGNKVIVSTPVYFIMNSENARKPIEPAETRESDEQNWDGKKEFEPHEVTPENVRSEAVDVVDAPAAAQYTPPVDEALDEVLGPADDADAAPVPEIKNAKKLRKKVKED